MEVSDLTVSRETELGTITISNLLFAQIIADSFKIESCTGKVWPSTKKGRQIGSDGKYNLSEFASNIEVERSLYGESVDIEFNIIVKFGTSIRNITDDISDYVAGVIYKKQGKKPNQIKIRIAGVKSRQVARRNLEVVKKYESE